MRHEFTLPEYGWRVVVWYLDGEHGSPVDAIEADLRRIGCSGSNMDGAMRLLRKDAPNTGLTYSNRRRGRSVMVIGRTTGASECANTLVHERKHLEYHICQEFGIDPYSEEAAYLAGDIAAKMYGQAKRLLCCDCREKFLNKKASHV